MQAATPPLPVFGAELIHSASTRRLAECGARWRAPAPNLGDAVVLGEKNGVIDQPRHQNGDAEAKPRHQGKCHHRTATGLDAGYGKGETCNPRSPSDGDRYDH